MRRIRRAIIVIGCWLGFFGAVIGSLFLPPWAWYTLVISLMVVAFVMFIIAITMERRARQNRSN